jgi:UDP-glucose 4-epimerase
MHILITGGAGFIGSHLAEYHLSQGHQVYVVDNLSTGSLDNILPFTGNANFHFDEADILTWPELDKTVAWADRVYHMAAVVGVFKVLEDPIRVLATNVAGCERLLRAAHAAKWSPQILIASSSEVYGRGDRRKPLAGGRDKPTPSQRKSDTKRDDGFTEFREDMDMSVGSSAISRWTYSISKMTDEAFALSYARRYGMNIVVARFFNMIGPRQTGRYGMVVPRFVKQAVNGAPITIYGDGSQMRCFCDVRDTVAALDLLARNPASAGEIVNVGNNREISIGQLAALVKERSVSSSPIISIPYHEAYGEDFEEIYHRKPSLEKLFSLTRFTHQWSLEKTLDDLIERERRKTMTEIEI